MKQIKQKRKNSLLNTGFSNRIENEGDRLLNKDGSFNVRKTGLQFLERFNVFHWLIKMSWFRFFVIMFISYITINLAFASLYFLAGIEGLSGDHSNSILDQFLDAFYFSTQTLTTVGYGYFSPIGEFHSLLASFESFIGLMSFAMATGLLYGKFSKPKSGIIYSKNALISPYREEGKGLMIRIANAKDNQLINLSATLIISWINISPKGNTRKYYFLKLEMSKVDLLATSWTLVHPIDEDSPIYEMTIDDLKSKNVEIIVQLQGYDESYSQEIHSRTSYKSEEIIWGAKFISIMGHDKDGSILKLDGLDLYELTEFDN